MSPRPISELDMAVLRVLPRDLDGGRRWLTPRDVADKLGLAVDVARSVLVRLRGRGLIEDDGERPQAFARTPAAEHALEFDELDAGEKAE